MPVYTYSLQPSEILPIDIFSVTIHACNIGVTCHYNTIRCYKYSLQLSGNCIVAIVKLKFTFINLGWKRA